VHCGHVHESRGYVTLDGTLVVNPGPLKLGYYAIVDYGENKAILKRLG
jgi:Icc-related predicted phosphoesterase